MEPQGRSSFWPKRLRWRTDPDKLADKLTDKLNEGLLQLSQKVLALANLSTRLGDPPVKRSYSHPTPHLLLVSLMSLS
jgi:hypothetical protein